MEILDSLPILLFETQEDLHSWLSENCAQQTGVWIKIAKKASGKKSVSYSEALEEALCYGWIDATKKSYDELYFLQKFTPRRAKSIWSKVNVDKVTSLIAAGKMQPSGFAVAEAAKSDGRWERAYDSSSTITIPADFQKELDKYPKANEFFASLNNTETYSILWRLQTTKNPELRKNKIVKYVAMLNNGEKLH